jgi:UDP-3-O-[3-hydroxymyristoyl] glucosamine N-acyltransferase
MAAVICPEPSFAPRVDTSAVISSSAIVADSAHIAANAVIGDRTTVGENVYVGPGTVIGPDCVVSDDCRLVSSVTFVKDVRVGARCIFHSGAVIGSDGFGNAMTREGWVKIPQLGGVQIGSDVEIGANSTVDCGSNGDTVLGNGVRIDNLCQIGHNVRIGDHTALVAQTVIAGSTVVGKRCMFAGAGGAVGHLHICDDVIVLAKSFVSKDITEAGTYAASFPAVKTKSWSRQVARFRRLDNLIERVKKLEK